VVHVRLITFERDIERRISPPVAVDNIENYWPKSLIFKMPVLEGYRHSPVAEIILYVFKREYTATVLAYDSMQ